MTTTHTNPSTSPAPRKARAAKAAATAVILGRDGRPIAAMGTYTVPTGYAVRWPHRSFDLLKKVDLTLAGPAWLVTCNAHSTDAATMAAATSGPGGDAIGSRTGRATWCPGCGATVAKPAKAKRAA